MFSDKLEKWFSVLFASELKTLQQQEKNATLTPNQLLQSALLHANIDPSLPLHEITTHCRKLETKGDQPILLTLCEQWENYVHTVHGDNYQLVASMKGVDTNWFDDQKKKITFKTAFQNSLWKRKTIPSEFDLLASDTDVSAQLSLARTKRSVDDFLSKSQKQLFHSSNSSNKTIQEHLHQRRTKARTRVFRTSLESWIKQDLNPTCLLVFQRPTEALDCFSVIPAKKLLYDRVQSRHAEWEQHFIDKSFDYQALAAEWLQEGKSKSEVEMKELQSRIQITGPKMSAYVAFYFIGIWYHQLLEQLNGLKDQALKLELQSRTLLTRLEEDWPVEGQTTSKRFRLFKEATAVPEEKGDTLISQWKTVCSTEITSIESWVSILESCEIILKKTLADLPKHEDPYNERVIMYKHALTIDLSSYCMGLTDLLRNGQTPTLVAADQLQATEIRRLDQFHQTVRQQALQELKQHFKGMQQLYTYLEQTNKQVLGVYNSKLQELTTYLAEKEQQIMLHEGWMESVFVSAEQYDALASLLRKELLEKKAQLVIPEAAQLKTLSSALIHSALWYECEAALYLCP
jgi:hypothetical protein